MMIKSVVVENYRSIKNETLHCNGLTVLVGANGSGKSSFIRAIDMFQTKSPALKDEDYYNRQTSKDICITVTFNNLQNSEKELFADYVVDGNLVVQRVLKWVDGGRPTFTYYGIKPQNPDFAGIYSQKKGAQKKYEDMLESGVYGDFPEWSNYENITKHLKAWEMQNPDKLKPIPDDGKFFTHNLGFPSRFVRFLYIKPVHDVAEDAQDEKKTVLAELMGLAVKNSLMTDPNIKKFQNTTQRKYKSLMDSTGKGRMNKLEDDLTKTIRQFVPDARVDLSWSSTKLPIEPPSAEIKLVEDEYSSTVSGAGHGLQRVFAMSILQHLSEVQGDLEEKNVDESPTLVLMIDEPELYQHPNRQRHMSKVLLSLANKSISGASGTMQIIYSTHSPHFVGIDRLDQIRLVRKYASSPDMPKMTHISSTSLKDVAAELETVLKKRETERDLGNRLQTIMTSEMNEGFFANVVVLVEGPGDRAALTAIAKSINVTLESHGISIIPCNSKHNLGRPAMIFKKLKIPLYIVWDADGKNKDSGTNHDLLTIMDKVSVDDLLGVHDRFACLDATLEDEVEKSLGGEFKEYKRRCVNDLHPGRGNAIKKPYVISYMIDIAKRDGVSFPILEEIVQQVLGLCPGYTRS